jgi:hypothetical protein
MLAALVPVFIGMLKVNFRYLDLEYPVSHRCKIIWNFLLSFQLTRIKTEHDKAEFILEKFVLARMMLNSASV